MYIRLFHFPHHTNHPLTQFSSPIYFIFANTENLDLVLKGEFSYYFCFISNFFFFLQTLHGKLELSQIPQRTRSDSFEICRNCLQKLPEANINTLCLLRSQLAWQIEQQTCIKKISGGIFHQTCLKSHNELKQKILYLHKNTNKCERKAGKLCVYEKIHENGENSEKI